MNGGGLLYPARFSVFWKPILIEGGRYTGNLAFCLFACMDLYDAHRWGVWVDEGVRVYMRMCDRWVRVMRGGARSVYVWVGADEARMGEGATMRVRV